MADANSSTSQLNTGALRQCGWVAALATTAFIWVSVLSFHPDDWPNPAVWPHPSPAINACGRGGAWLAYSLLHYLGHGVYPLLGLLTLAAIQRLSRRAPAGTALRAIGMCLLIAVAAAGATFLDPRPHDGLMAGGGGILGQAVSAGLLASLSNTGAALVLVAGGIVGVLLALDDLMLLLPRLLLTASRHAGAIAQTLRRAGAASRTLTPVTIGAGRHTTVLDPVQPRPARTSVDPPSSPADEEAAVPKRPRGSEPDEGDDPRPTAADTPGPSRTIPERDLIVRMLGRDRVENKPPKSAWPTELGDYVLPPLSLLRDPERRYTASQEGVVREKAAIIERTLAEFRIEVRVVEIDTGPVVTFFEIELSAGTKVSQIHALANDIARALKAPGVRVVAPIAGKHTIGIEVPNVDKEKVRLKELVMLGGVKPTRMLLPVFIGKNASGDPLIVDITTMPHLLIAGTTGSGKSVSINTLVMSLLMTQRPDHVKLILVDPKMVELSAFKEIPHLMCPIVTDMQRAEMILQWATTKMDERYELLAEAQVKDIAAFNRLGKDEVYRRFQPSSEDERRKIPTHLPYIVILIDELADLMMTCGKEVEHHLSRLAQKSRAVGIHLIVATQRPQANVVTGLIKSNLPCRIAFRVASRMDSRIVLDQNGAEVLMGEGDMLFLPPGSAKLIRAQGTYIEEDEVRAVIEDLAGKARPEFHHELQRLKPDGDDEGGARDPLFDQAVSILVETRRGSVSLLQRRLEVGYSRASRLIDQMAAAGIVGEYKGSQAREVLLTDKEWQQIRRRRDAEMEGGDFRGDMEAEDDDRFGSADLDQTVPDLIHDEADLRD